MLSYKINGPCNISWFSANVILAVKLLSCFIKASTLLLTECTTSTASPTWSTLLLCPLTVTALSLLVVSRVCSRSATRCWRWLTSANRRFISANSFVRRSTVSSWTRRLSRESTRTLSKWTAWITTTPALLTRNTAGWKTRAQLLPRMADRTRAVKTTLFTSALRRIFSNR